MSYIDEEREFQVILAKYTTKVQFYMTGFFASLALLVAVFAVSMAIVNITIIDGIFTFAFIMGFGVFSFFCYYNYLKNVTALENLKYRQIEHFNCRCSVNFNGEK